MPIRRLYAAFGCPLEDLGVVAACVHIVDPRSQAFHDVAPGIENDAHIGMADQRLSNLVQAVI